MSFRVELISYYIWKDVFLFFQLNILFVFVNNQLVDIHSEHFYPTLAADFLFFFVSF